MFKTVLFATAIVAAQAWERSYNDRIQPEAYGADNQHYGHQGSDYGYGKRSVSRKGGYGRTSYGGHKGHRSYAGGRHGIQSLGGLKGLRGVGGLHGHGRASGYGGSRIGLGGRRATSGARFGGIKGRALGGSQGQQQWNVADSHNSYRQVGHQGQGHNQWVDNAWNQWGTNNHWEAQKSVDNKWGNNSGKINVTLNSVSGHYDHDFGQQQRGLGYEGHRKDQRHPQLRLRSLRPRLRPAAERPWLRGSPEHLWRHRLHHRPRRTLLRLCPRIPLLRLCQPCRFRIWRLGQQPRSLEPRCQLRQRRQTIHR